jgi:hypothetical protein
LINTSLARDACIAPKNSVFLPTPFFLGWLDDPTAGTALGGLGGCGGGSSPSRASTESGIGCPQLPQKRWLPVTWSWQRGHSR